MRLVGPNCVGVVNTAIGLDATFSPYAPSAGRIAMQSQSGALGIAILERSARIGLGVSSFVSVGNKADVSGNDLLQYWEDDPGTDVVLLYLESFGNPHKFARIARRVSRRKPIVAVKSGRSAAGVRAASSHTAAMASPDIAVDALFRQAGVIRVDTLDELFDMALVLGSQPLPAGNRVAIVGNSGGPGILATDACDGAGLEVPELSAATQAALRAVVDPIAAVFQPRRPGGIGDPGGVRTGARASCSPTTPSTRRSSSARPPSRPRRRDIADVLRRSVCRDGQADARLLPGLARPPAAAPSRTRDQAGGDVPAFASPEPAARALARAASYAELAARGRPARCPTSTASTPHRAQRCRRRVPRPLARRRLAAGRGRSTRCSPRSACPPSPATVGRHALSRPRVPPPSSGSRWRSRQPGLTWCTSPTSAACASDLSSEDEVADAYRSMADRVGDRR